MKRKASKMNKNFSTDLHFRCDKCERICDRKDAMIRHISAHSDLKNVIPLQLECNKCYSKDTFSLNRNSNDETSSEVLIADLPMVLMEEVYIEPPEEDVVEYIEDSLQSTTETLTLQKIKDQIRSEFEKLLQKVKNETEANIVADSLELCECELNAFRQLRKRTQTGEKN